ncbi:MAG: hypothetical protein ACK5CA_05775 [Cyanobacteriota bacterium]
MESINSTCSGAGSFTKDWLLPYGGAGRSALVLNYVNGAGSLG